MEDIIKDKKILVVGLGKSGLAACKVLLEKGGICLCTGHDSPG